jgi:hypothetical protein
MTDEDNADLHHGFKRINAANLQQSDISRAFGRGTPEAWVGGFSRVQLDARVPQEIAALFEVARGAMIYGWFFYPLMTLGAEQCYRVMEAGIRARCAQLGIPVVVAQKDGTGRPVSFGRLMQTLTERGLIRDDDKALWDIAKDLRNWASHPEAQTILTPPYAHSALARAAELLGKLFTA